MDPMDPMAMDGAHEAQIARLRSINDERRQSRAEEERVVYRWAELTQNAAPSTASDVPNYWNDDLTILSCRANIHGRIALGTGEDVFKTIAGVIGEAREEVILVTCFWAHSKSLDDLNAALRKLSTKERPYDRKARVRICFSSLSLRQKLFHTNSPAGQIYPPSQWKSRLGLPDPSELTGLDLEVKSIFFRPFSVWHPKFAIIDRKWVYLPSCNVSWEPWLECSITVSGDSIVAQFITFWKAAWASDADKASTTYTAAVDVETWVPHPAQVHARNSSIPNNSIFESVRAIFLPSPHHTSPNFALWPWTTCPAPPPTPLNNFLLAAFEHATTSIYIQTPNLTSPPVLTALLAALKRGVTVSIITNASLMWLEQLATAGTTTLRCMKTFKTQHERLVAAHKNPTSSSSASLLEAGDRKKPGWLTIDFWEPHPAVDTEGVGPVRSHMKLTIVDEHWTILGSGNMDRASWFTSQEVGLALQSREYAAHVFEYVWGKWVRQRRVELYDSRGGS